MVLGCLQRFAAIPFHADGCRQKQFVPEMAVEPGSKPEACRGFPLIKEIDDA